MMNDKTKVLVGMSGGIDSCIASILLKNQGYEVIGATFRTWDYITDSCLAKQTGCCSIDSIHEAAQFAQNNGFEHHILDMRENFKYEVIEPFVHDYISGKTPNPCVLCNSEIKWGLMLKKADELNCEFIATGHYAGIRKYENNYVLIDAKDSNKDQTYFLWRLNSYQLSRTIFPLSNLTKEQVKKIAAEYGFESILKKRESQEICFIPNNNYRDFIKKEYPHLLSKQSQGSFLDVTGNIIGQHKGTMNYTIGQRKGLGIALGYPAYVVSIDNENNTVTLGNKDDLYKSSMKLRSIVINKYNSIPESFKADVKIRYNSHKVEAICNVDNHSLYVNFIEKVSSITPGQSAVIYQGDECIGGGIIC